MATKSVTGKVTDAANAGVKGVVVKAFLSQGAVVSGTSEVPPFTVSATSASDGTYSLTLQANNDLTPNGTYYRVDEGGYQYNIVVPQSAGPFPISTIQVDVPPLATPSAQHVASLVVDTSITAGTLVHAGTLQVDTGPLAVPAASIAESAVTGLVADLASKATDSLAAHLAGTETFTGVKASSTWKFSGPVPWADVLHPTYGGNDNGVADNATAIQAAINALSAIGGGIVKCSFLTSGIYAFATTITLKTGVVIELDPNVTLKWTGAAGGTMFTTSTVTPVQKSGIVCKGGFGIVDPGGTTNGADIIFDLHSVQLCEFGNLQGLSARSTSICFKLQADCSVITNSDLKTNCGLNTFHDIEWTGRIGIGIQKSGLAVSNNGDGNASVITLNDFRNFSFRDVQNIAVNVVQWADDDIHTGIHTYKLNADNAIGIVLNNSGTPAANVGVYCQQWQYVAIPFFGAFTGRQGIIFNYTKQNVIRNYLEDPSAGASAVVDNNSLSHYIERIGVPSVNNLVNYSKNSFLLDESGTATGPSFQFLKWRPNQADTQANDELMNLAGYLWQTGAQVGPVAGWKYVQQVVTAGALQGQMRFMAAHGASAYAARVYLNTDGRIGTGGNAQVNAGVQAVPPAAGTTALRVQQAAGQTNPLIDAYASNGSTQLPFTVDASGVLTTPTISTPLVTGAGQATASVDTTTSLASALRLLDTGSSANNGGMVLFGAGAGYWAAIKGLEVNNANNTTGDLVISIRNATTDGTLTERWRLAAAGTMTLNSAGANVQYLSTSGVTRGAQNSAQTGYPFSFPAVGTVTAETPLVTVSGPTHTITGGFASQRFSRFDQPTISAGSALTVTTAGTLAVVDAPAAAASAVITNPTALWLQSGLATPAGGSAKSAILMGSAPAVGVFFGSGAPTNTAPKGSLYLRTDGTTTNDRAYINTNGSTTWTALTTAA